MDRSWLRADRRSLAYELGVDEFLEFASANARYADRILCPCIKCGNMKAYSVGIIKEHLYWNGIDVGYTNWVWHGEPSRMSMGGQEQSESIEQIVDDMETEQDEGNEHMGETDLGEPQLDEDEDDGQFYEDSHEFMKVVEDGDIPLWPGNTRHTKLNALIRSYDLKAKHRMTEACYSDWMDLIGDLLPQDNVLPTTLYEEKKTLRALGMDYTRIHACPKDCILYRGEYIHATNCPKCGLSRWKLGRDKKERNGVPAKCLWYFPPIPRLKRMFQSTSVAQDLTWHADKRLKDGLMRHPADSPTWKLIDDKFPEFGSEPRNLRLALSSDGFNPHSSMSSKYSCWPVMLVMYNLPPWLCMKRRFLMLTLLISGPKAPGNNIDVYLQPLIEYLKILWDGVDGVYDACRGEYFKMKAILFWTINDFPAYGNFSGSVVHGYKACPICSDKIGSIWLNHGHKTVHLGYRRWLPTGHCSRKKKAGNFIKPAELDEAPIPLTGEETLNRMKEEELERNNGKKRKHPFNPEDLPLFNKKSVFFQLEYWKIIPVRHNLDMMHIEKNACESLYATLLNVLGKTKDSASTRLDMDEHGIGEGLQPIQGGRGVKLPSASWNLLAAEKRIVCECFLGMKTVEGFCSNISNLVNMKDLTLTGLKSHDCHTVMQQLLPIAIRSVLDKPVRYAIISLCLFFKAICSKVIDPSKLKKIQSDLVDTLCLLEMFFPPSFFDISIHLTIHLVREVELCGPVFFRLMYPFERYMKVFKGSVKSRVYPEGCIAEAYIAAEAAVFLNERVNNEGDVEIPQSATSGFGVDCKRLSMAKIVSVDENELEMAHLCILQNLDEAAPYFEEHMMVLKDTFPRNVIKEKWLKDKQNKTFSQWLKMRVAEQLRDANHNVSETLRWIADGASPHVLSFQGYDVNGIRFSTKDRDQARVFQNSGVSLVATAMQISSAKDKNPITQAMNLYGQITEIWEMDYQKVRVPVFRCNWAASDERGVKVDDVGFTLVNFNRLGFKKDPFVLARDVKQVFYIDDPKESGWSVVVRCPDKDYVEELGDLEVENEPYVPTVPTSSTFDDVFGLQCNNKNRLGEEEFDEAV